MVVGIMVIELGWLCGKGQTTLIDQPQKYYNADPEEQKVVSAKQKKDGLMRH